MKKTYQKAFCELLPISGTDVLTFSKLNNGYGDTVSWNIPTAG